jgi:uncharacterized protein YgbK (DUF1537 family)
MLIGAIGDEFSESAELAALFAAAGLRTAHFLGQPHGRPQPGDEAVVVTLRLRTLAPEEAARQAIAAAEWLLAAGAPLLFAGHAASFLSTTRGSIGPVLEALADLVDARTVLVCPAQPGNGRTLYQGHLFVGARLVSESGLERHPVTPMTDPDIVRHLGRQSKGRVGLIGLATVQRGREPLRTALREAPERLVAVDAISNEDLHTIAAVAADQRLVGGSGGLAGALAGLLAGATRPPLAVHGVPGPGLVLCGSNATASRAQASHHARNAPALQIPVQQLLDGSLSLERIAAFLAGNRDSTPLLAVMADPIEIATLQTRHGRQRVAEQMDQFFSQAMQMALAAGYRRFILAGSDTAAAAATVLGAACLDVGPMIEPGIAAMRLRGSQPLALAWKSGNTGSRDLFSRALSMLAAGSVPV